MGVREPNHDLTKGVTKNRQVHTNTTAGNNTIRRCSSARGTTTDVAISRRTARFARETRERPAGVWLRLPAVAHGGSGASCALLSSSSSLSSPDEERALSE